MDPTTQDPIQSATDAQNDINSQLNEQWIARHNETIIGFYGNSSDANDALSGYKMDKIIDLNDVLEVRQII